MRVALLYNEVGAQAGPDEADVLVQLEAVTEGLSGLGHEVLPLACGLDLGAVARELEAQTPDAVFNLVESLAGHERLIHVMPALLDALGWPCTGSSAEAILLTTNKLLAKERLAAAGLPTPPLLGVWPAGGGEEETPELSSEVLAERAIAKSVWDHGSKGLADDAVLRSPTAGEVRRHLRELAPRLGSPCFAETYVEGRELNLSLLASPCGSRQSPQRAVPQGDPQILPPAEVRFVGYPPGKLRIVDYRAKWEPASFEYQATEPSYDFPARDAPLLAEIAGLARHAWKVFGLAGWARVDFRVAADGTPWILEVNANPCLAPDAGFAAALEQAGLSFPQALERILEDALQRRAAAGSRAAVLSPARA